MNLADIANDLFSRAFDQSTRAIRLRFGTQIGALFDGVLVPERIDITEAVCDGITAHITCLTTRADLPLRQLVGLPVEVQLATDTGGLRRICVVITEVRQGQSDGALTALQLTGRDIFAVMDQRRSNRVFLNKSVLDIARTVLSGWRTRFAPVAQAFD